MQVFLANLLFKNNIGKSLKNNKLKVENMELCIKTKQ